LLCERRNIKYLLHLFIEENDLIVLGYNDAIIIHLDETAKHVNQLPLLSCALEVFSVSLIESSSEKVNVNDCNAFVELHSRISDRRYVKIISHSEVNEA
jgi:hypothetical protein